MVKIDLSQYLKAYTDNIKHFCASMIALFLILQSVDGGFTSKDFMILLGYGIYRLGYFLWNNPIEYHDCITRRKEDKEA